MGQKINIDQQDWLSVILQDAGDAIISKDLNGVITSWNETAEELFGYSAEEAIGKKGTILYPSDRIQEEDNILGKIRRGERVKHFKTVRQSKTGDRRNILLTASPIKNSEGKIIGVSKIAHDITEKKKLENALEVNRKQLY
ncbi:MAG TPA: PAS domain S-box protein, partial [Balneolaceae bacterium]|nr:PAS domain S-box protein [Balneolaceae bacterium]